MVKRRPASTTASVVAIALSASSASVEAFHHGHSTYTGPSKSVRQSYGPRQHPTTRVSLSASLSSRDLNYGSPDSDSNSSAGLSALNSAEELLSTTTSLASDILSETTERASELISESQQQEDYVDEYEVEQELLKQRRAAAAKEIARRRNEYEVTVSLTEVVGLTLREIVSNTSGGKDAKAGMSTQALDFDTLRLFDGLTSEEMDPTLRDGSVEMFSGTSSESLSSSSQGRVMVSSVVRDGAAWKAGIRPGDVVLATSATVGQKMWPKTTLEGVRSAISSRRVLSSSIKIQLQKRAGTGTASAETNGSEAADSVGAASSTATDNADTLASDAVTTFDLTLSRPLGINVEDGPDGYVAVTGLNPAGSNDVNDISSVQIGDRIVAVDSSLGSQMWPVSNVAGLVSACTSRLPGQTVSLRFERLTSLAAVATEKTNGEATGAAAAAVLAEPSEQMKEEAERTRQVLLARCRDVLQKYTQQYKADEVTPAVMLSVADKIVAALADASASPDAATLNLLMNAYVVGSRPDDAIRIFEASTGVSADGSAVPPSGDRLILPSKVKEGFRIMPNLEALNLYTATSLLRAHSLKRDGLAARRVLAAMEGKTDLVVGGIRAASWRNVEDSAGDKWAVDGRCYNMALAAAAKMNSSSGLKIATEIFQSMIDPKASKEEWAANSNSAPFRDSVSYNSMISAYARVGRIQESMTLFGAMKKCGLKPDKFTYTSIIKAHVKSGDVDAGISILTDMESKGVEADVFAYNTVIKGLCDKYRWFEAKELVTEMEWNGVRPDSYTYGMLMNGLVKAGNPGPALTLFESACSDPRTVNIAQNVQIYTTAVTAASMLGDHARALGLVSRMVSSGVKPNIKTFTSLMGGCLSSGKTSYALDIFGKISEHDGYSLQLGIRAFCDAGDYSSARSILTEQRDARREMSGKQVMASYDYIIKSSLQRRNFKIAREVFTELIDSGYVPSKTTYRVIPEALSLVPKRGETRPQINDDNRAEAEAAFDFMIFVMDITERRNLSVAGAFYASVLFEGARAGGLRKKVASLIAESKLSMEGGRRIDVFEGSIECAEEERCIGWQDVLDKYKEYEGQGISLPNVLVNANKQSIRLILSAEQQVSYGRSRRRRAQV